MRAMKDSGIEWIGEVPEHWSIRRLKYLVSYNDNVLSENTNKNYEFAYIDIGTISNNCICDPEIMIFEKAPSRARRIVKDKDVIVSTVRTYLKAVAKIRNFEKDLIVSTGFIVLRAKTIKIEPSFLYYSVLSEYFISSVVANSVGISYPAINSSNFVALSIALPPLPEQQRIADFLDKKCGKIDDIVDKQRKLIEKLKEYKQAVITEAVTKGLDRNVPMKDSGIEWIGEVPENWKITRLKYVAQLSGRIGFRGYRQDDLVGAGEGPITLSPSNIGENGCVYDKCAYLSWEKYNESPEIQVSLNDIIFVKTGSSYGKSCLVNELPCEATINPQLLIVRSYNTKNSKANYLCYMMQSMIFNYQVEISVVGGTIPTISQEKIYNFIVPIPTLPEQQRIADFLDKKCGKIDVDIERREEIISKLQEYKKALIYEAVTGKREVPNV